MAIIETLLQELEQEAQTTRRVLERVPDAQLGWKPHAKSMSLGQLALHVATVPGGVAEIAARPGLDSAPEFVQPSAASASELVPALVESVARARTLLGGMDDRQALEMWTLKSDGQVLMSMPRAALLRAIMLNHWYHHRGQLSVYLRQLNVPLPSIYGPSADENPFAHRAAAATA
jgi:uncharacterized damage-inducible protein DinB